MTIDSKTYRPFPTNYISTAQHLAILTNSSHSVSRIAVTDLKAVHKFRFEVRPSGYAISVLRITERNDVERLLLLGRSLLT